MKTRMLGSLTGATVLLATGLFATAAEAQTVNVGGTWETDSGASGGNGAGHGTMNLVQSGGAVVWTYASGGGTYVCTLAGSVCQGTWQGHTGSGWFNVTFGPDSASFSGFWGYAGNAAPPGTFAGRAARAMMARPAGAIVKEDVQGNWSATSFGHMVLRIVGNQVWGTYDHDDGTIVGTFENGVFRGWWSELPSRAPTGDAGEVEFRFARRPNGQLVLDGRWRYGVDGAWDENWDLTMTSDPVNGGLLTRFSDPSQFRRHP
ncbi:MAG: hypothetical protein WCJ30_08055 [Deltaproteobacteria bacterium]